MLVAAFVTFENEDSYIRCMADYDRYSQRYLFRPWTWLVPPQPNKIKFKGQHKLVVEASPEPSNIMWENLETPMASSVVRKTITATITITMLLVSLALVIIVKQVKANVEKSVPDLSKCTAGLPGVYGVDEGSEFEWLKDFDQYCPAGER